MASSFCTQCGASLIAGAPFCSNCGAVTGNASTQPVPATVAVSGYGAAAAPAPVYAVPVAGVPKPAGFWIRFVAWVIDYILFQIVLFIFGFVIGLVGAASNSNTGAIQAAAGMISLVGWVLGGWLYDALMTSSSKQGTLGKMAVGLKVVDENGRRISFGQATGRFLAKILSGLILLIGYIMAAFTERKRALHDMLAGTYVVYKN